MRSFRSVLKCLDPFLRRIEKPAKVGLILVGKFFALHLLIIDEYLVDV